MRICSGRLFLFVMLLVASGVAVGPCRALAASAATEADAAIKHGVELRRRGDDLRALEAFQHACALQRSARALAQIGFAEQALGRWRDAEEHLGQALADSQGNDQGDDQGKDQGYDDNGWIRRNRATIERSRALVAGHLGSLEVLGGPEGAELLVDGLVVGRLPLPRPLRVAAGSIGVEVRAAGYLPVSRPVTIAAGELSRETITLQKVAAATVPPPRGFTPVPMARQSTGNGAGLPGIADLQRVPEASGGGWQRTAAWVSGGAATLFAAVAVVGLVARDQYSDRLDGHLRDGRCVQHGDQFTGDGGRDCAVAATDRDRAATLTLVSGGVAGILALASTILFVAVPRADDHARSEAQARSVVARPRLACAPAGRGAELQCGGWF